MYWCPQCTVSKRHDSMDFQNNHCVSYYSPSTCFYAAYLALFAFSMLWLRLLRNYVAEYYIVVAVVVVVVLYFAFISLFYKWNSIQRKTNDPAMVRTPPLTSWVIKKRSIRCSFINSLHCGVNWVSETQPLPLQSDRLTTALQV